MSSPDDERPTIPAPYEGAPPCLALFCGEVALPGKTRCSRHDHRPSSQPRFPAVELLCERGAP